MLGLSTRECAAIARVLALELAGRQGAHTMGTLVHVCLPRPSFGTQGLLSMCHINESKLEGGSLVYYSYHALQRKMMHRRATESLHLVKVRGLRVQPVPVRLWSSETGKKIAP